MKNPGLFGYFYFFRFQVIVPLLRLLRYNVSLRLRIVRMPPNDSSKKHFFLAKIGISEVKIDTIIDEKFSFQINQKINILLNFPNISLHLIINLKALPPLHRNTLPITPRIHFDRILYYWPLGYKFGANSPSKCLLFLISIVRTYVLNRPSINCGNL
jgi:hypothetical protein